MKAANVEYQFFN